MTYKELDKLVVNGIEFQWGEDGLSEYFEHVDQHRWQWRVFKRKGKMTEVDVWEAEVKDEANGGYILLTCARLSSNDNFVIAGPLGNVNGRDLDEMIIGVVGLIKANFWPSKQKPMRLSGWRKEFADD